MSNVDRLYNELANWLADMRMANPGVRIPMCSVEYKVSAPAGGRLLHTFVVRVVGGSVVARGGGDSIDGAARQCWAELAGRDANEVRLPRMARVENGT